MVGHFWVWISWYENSLIEATEHIIFSISNSNSFTRARWTALVGLAYSQRCELFDSHLDDGRQVEVQEVDARSSHVGSDNLVASEAAHVIRQLLLKETA